jgi:hypothetical protein
VLQEIVSASVSDCWPLGSQAESPKLLSVVFVLGSVSSCGAGTTVSGA